MQEKNLSVISLGCDKNRVDTERMLERLKGGNFKLTDTETAQIIIINTCAFIQSARQEAIDTILSAAQLKSDKLEKLIVTGCLPQKYMPQLKEQLPEVDAFLGIGSYDQILDVINDLYQDKQVALSQLSDTLDFQGRTLTTENYAYLKISDGCNNHCTYCTIPSIRGKYRSRSIDSLVLETQEIASKGIKEIILVAQDITRYGLDLYGEVKLIELLQKLSGTDISFIRLLYCYPEMIDDRLIAEIKNNDKILKYIDIPLQHISDKILKAMGRRGSGQDIKDLISRLRRNIPHIAIRTTFITGFPGEGQTEHDQLVDFIKEYKLNNVGFFVYSKEQDTPSAKLSDKVLKRTANKRLKELAAAQQEVVKEYNQGYIGQTLDVLYEGIDYDKQMFYGRSYQSAPIIDPLIYFSTDYAQAGSIYKIKITGYKGYDLIGESV